jgi:hypothetical protein
MTTLTKAESIRDLMSIPGVGKSIAYDLLHIGIKQVSDLKNKDPQELYDASNKYAGAVQDRCLLYVFRCAVYFASTPAQRQTKEKLKWWYWKDKK